MRRTRTSIGERVEDRGGHRFIRLKSGRLLGFWGAIGDAERAHTTLGTAISRCFRLVENEYDLERLEWFVDNLHSHIHAIEAEIEKRRGVRRVEDRIALLRNTVGRTPEEADIYQRKADELERQMRDGHAA